LFLQGDNSENKTGGAETDPAVVQPSFGTAGARGGKKEKSK